jgi:MAF protein
MPGTAAEREYASQGPTKRRASSRLVLASGSPRRRHLLATLGVAFAVIPPDVDETPLMAEPAGPLALRLASLKAAAVATARPDAVVIGADTVVTQRGELFGKPSSAAAAMEMLARLRARQHEVVTGVCVIPPGGHRLAGAIRTTVYMRDYTDEELLAYVAGGEAFDKAGAYAIQDASFRPVREINGCYSNVVGLPLCLSADLLRRAGLRLPRSAATCRHELTPE